MTLSYSRLRGLPVRTADGQTLGRLADIMIGRAGEEAVATQFVVARNRAALLAMRFGASRGITVIDASRLESIDEQELRLRDTE